MGIDVVCVNYHTPDLLADFVRSYRLESWPGCTLTVVDVDVEERATPPHFLHENVDFYMPRSGNIGYARACNDGAKAGTNPVILLANADTQLSSALVECYEQLGAHGKWGALGPRQTNAAGYITAGGIIGPVWSPRQRHWNEYDNGQCSDVVEDCYSVSGSLYFIKRRLWEELTNCSVMQQLYPGIEGAFIPTPHYFEETTCSRHLVAHGYTNVFYGPAKMIHHWHAASEHGGWADRQFNTSLQMHRDFCDAHSIEHE